MKTHKKASGIPVYCSHDTIVPLAELKPNPQNPNYHPAEQIELLANIIKENGWRDRITVSNLSGLIVKGHGRYQAAALAGLDKAPVDYQNYASQADEVRDLIADNKIAELSEIDNEQARALIESLSGDNIGADYDISEFGITDETLKQFGYTQAEIQEFFSNEAADGDDDDKYTRNIEAPIYRPKGYKPEIKELFNKTKTDKLITEIQNSDIPKEVKVFLITAARRHTVFNYGLIAEYYAHANKDIQRLMENSGLVIIDFNRAIELGYVRLSEKIAEQYRAEHAND